MRFGHIGGQVQCLLQIFLGFVIVGQFHMHDAKIIVERGIFRIHLQSVKQAANGVFRPAQVLQNSGKGMTRFHISRPLLQCHVEALGRFHRLILSVVNQTQIVVRFRKLMLQSNGLPKGGSGVFKAIHGKISVAQIIQGNRIVRPQLERLLVGRDGFIELPARTVSFGKIMVIARLIWLKRDGLLDEFNRLRQPLLMETQKPQTMNRFPDRSAADSEPS